MSTLACPECGAPIGAKATRCDECGATARGRKRGELNGVRIDQERLVATLPEGDDALQDGQWGSARASGRPSPAPETRAAAGKIEGDIFGRARVKRQAAGEPVAAISAPAAGVATGSVVAAVAPAQAKAPAVHADAARAARNTQEAAQLAQLAELEPVAEAVQPVMEPLPLDAEVVVLVPHTDPGAAIQHAPIPGEREARMTPTSVTVPIRPPILASEALLRDLAPAEPAPRVLRAWSPILGCLGALTVYALTRGHGMGVPLMGAFSALALLGVSPMPYAARASAVATVASTGLGLLLWMDIANPDGLETVLLTVAVTLLASGLYFRAWHRGSLLARMLVTCGLLAGGTFLWTSGALVHLTMFDTEWQSWVPRLIGLPFGLLLMLALLAFMDARTTAGAAAWASCVLLWYGLYTSVELLRDVWPKGTAAPDFARVSIGMKLASCCAPLFTALLALGLAQLLAAALAGAMNAVRERPSQRPM